VNFERQIIMSTLITGGAGFIGSNLVEELLNAGESLFLDPDETCCAALCHPHGGVAGQRH